MKLFNWFKKKEKEEPQNNAPLSNQDITSLLDEEIKAICSDLDVQGEVVSSYEILPSSFSDDGTVSYDNFYAPFLREDSHLEIKVDETDYLKEEIIKTPFTKDDVKAKKGEFDKLQDLLKDDKLHADMAAADFYHGGHSQEDPEYGASYDDMRCANYCVEHRENEIAEAKDQIGDMRQTLEDNHTKLNADWNQSNEMDQGFEPDR